MVCVVLPSGYVRSPVQLYSIAVLGVLAFDEDTAVAIFGGTGHNSSADINIVTVYFIKRIKHTIHISALMTNTMGVKTTNFGEK